MEFNHTSVLLEETIENLRITPEGIYVDGTLGGGGHAFEVCKKLRGKGRLIGLDQDEQALEAAREKLSLYEKQVTVIHSNYEKIKDVLNEQKIDKVDGILLDLGVSSYQLDTFDRGFSYMSSDAPLDMRMDTSQEITASDIVNQYEEAALYQIFREYGEERFAKNIAKNIVKARVDKKIETTGELNGIIRSSIPVKAQMKGGHPSKRVFQAIRIELNRELEVLEKTLDDMVSVLSPGGRICIITFHSLEDRIVKNNFRKNEKPCTCPSSFPVCICGKESMGKVITRKPILPSEKELEENSRSKSAKLRVFEKNREKIYEYKTE